MEWSRILKCEAGRDLVIDSNGIVRDVEVRGGVGQESERQKRESAAAPFLRSSKQAVREAVRYHSRGVMRARARQVLEEMSESVLQTEAVLVDLGAGFGWHWVDLAREFSSVRFVLVDFAITNLLICRTLMPYHEYPNVLCIHSDISELPVEDFTVDYCWSVQVLQHLPPEKRRTVFHKISRLLKPHGRFYFGWLRSVPLVRSVYALFRKPYHEVGSTIGGMYLQRFDEEIRGELSAEFGHVDLTLSETLFHPDLRWAPSSRIIGALDLWLGRTPVARLLARQVEIWGSPSPHGSAARAGYRPVTSDHACHF